MEAAAILEARKIRQRASKINLSTKVWSPVNQGEKPTSGADVCDSGGKGGMGGRGGMGGKGGSMI